MTTSAAFSPSPGPLPQGRGDRSCSHFCGDSSALWGKGQAAKEAGSVPLMFMAKWISRTRERVKGEHRVPPLQSLRPRKEIGASHCVRLPPRCTLCARGHKDVAVVVMRENESAMAKKFEDVHSIYCSERAGVTGVDRRCADRMHEMQFAGVQHQSWCSRRAR